MSRDALFNALRPWTYPTKPEVPGFDGPRAIEGDRFGTNFIVTEGRDGQVELSLSVDGPGMTVIKAGLGHAAVFFGGIGFQPLSEDYSSSKIRHYVMFPPRPH